MYNTVMFDARVTTKCVMVLGLLSGLAGVGCHTPPAASHEPMLVHVTRLQSAAAQSAFRATGDIHARVESNLAFQTSGKVVARFVDVGDHVSAGAVLARLDSQQQQADVTIAEATLISATATLDRANLELGREKALYADAVTAKVKLDDAVRDQATAASAVAGAKARLDLAKETLSYTELRVAHAGTISTRTLEVGQVVATGTTVFTLDEDGPRDAVFRLDETVAGRVGQAAEVDIELIDDPRVHAQGTVREMAPAIDVGTASLRIKLALDNPPAQMALGAPVVANLPLTTTRTFTLPADALFSDTTESPAVWVVDAATKAVSLRRVVVASYESRSVIVREGLADGDLVVTDGASRLRPAQVVRFEQAGPA
jgi:RND family efflux transporter MFP subunit